MPLHVSSTVVLIIRRSKLYYTASVIVTPVGGRPVHRSSLNLCRGRPPTGVMIPDAVNTILTSWWWAQQCSKHVEAYNKLIIRQEFVH